MFLSSSRRTAGLSRLSLALTLTALTAPVAQGLTTGPTETAAYTVTFDSTWSAATHPTAFPGGAHFSGLVGGTHDDSVHFWTMGGLSSPGMESMAEFGGTFQLSNEVSTAVTAGSAGQVITGGVIFSSPGSANASFTVSQDHSLATLVTMIAPSPDWFVGVDGLDLLVDGNWVDELIIPLAAYDAGTDNGTSFTSPDSNTQPQQPISVITGFPFASGVPLGTFTFTRTDSPPTWSDLGGGLAGTTGTPTMTGSGQPSAGQAVALDVTSALPFAPAFLIFGLAELSAPFKGGTLVPTPDLILPGLNVASDGSLSLASTWPAGIPAGIPLVVQLWISDNGGPFAYAASNGVCTVSE